MCWEKTPHLTMSSSWISPPTQALGALHVRNKITLKVVVLHFLPMAPTYTTPLKSFTESDQTQANL